MNTSAVISTKRHIDGRRLASLFLVVTASMVVDACRATSPPAPISESAVRLELPLVKQDALYDCGLASLSALCQYWGKNIPEADRNALARSAAANEGLSGDELRSTLTRLGFDVFVFHGTLDHAATSVYGQVDAGRPPLVMLSPNGTTHHYELVLGYDEPRGNLILLDPVMGETLVPVATFERNWDRCLRFTLLAVPNETSNVAANTGTDLHSKSNP